MGSQEEPSQHSLSVVTSTDELPAVAPSKEELWKDAYERNVEGATIQMTGLESNNHIVYARVVSQNGSNPEVSIGTVVDIMVDEEWKRKVRDILERKQQVETDKYPPASTLLELGAVWLLNETAWVQGKDHHAHRLSEKDLDRIPNWQDMTLRVHYVPERFFVAQEFDWAKYCKGLLLDKTVQVQIGDETPHVPVTEGLVPDAQDGVILYEDHDHGFAILNKPGSMPVYPTRTNHAENLVEEFRRALEDRHSNDNAPKKIHVSVARRHAASLDKDTQGLVAVATKPEFLSYFDHLFDKQPKPVLKKFKCLVCVKDPDSMSLLEHFEKSGNVVKHWEDTKSPAPKRFVRHEPKKGNHKKWLECRLKVLQVGDDQFRAACVRSIYPNSVDNTLAKVLWGPDGAPADVKYVMELQVELVTERSYQLRGQLAALGFPIVGDAAHGGGTCEVHSHHHVWNRMALQCFDLEFPEPQWKDKKLVVSSDRLCQFRLTEAWWSQYMAQYELYHQSY